MGHSLEVQALNRDGAPLSGARVRIVIEGIFTGGSLESFTDRNGHAEFETAQDYESHRKLTIYVRGQGFGPYRISGGAYTVQLE